jgi:hypothetical protein
MAFLLSACVTQTGDYHRIADNGSFPAAMSIASDDSPDKDGKLTILSLNIAVSDHLAIVAEIMMITPSGQK